ncbi:uncharacterized protein N7443_009477 [Penicillium atrosanguineum]|uniref:uncharacterized protein n=1 Tax=Penicillium atrosanguineum TaxID=1132637 RepID=UPI00238DD4DF|nr:uncharacterized protein N7443_009477 [Penicillium atrosanguineum]KAJ5126438.1 Major facilitator superfamily domain general substrate transporter [Penicillium atrosanguineum]KAJ5293524.1 hypothetical protein N7443_009477 [Penicillium atrosanguineum]
MTVYLFPTIIATSLMWKLSHETHKIRVLFGYYIVGAYVCSLVLALQMPATNLRGYTKRTTSVALVFLAYYAGNIIGPHAFLAKEASIYQTGNKRRDEAASNVNKIDSPQDDYELADLTDFENPYFRYVL